MTDTEDGLERGEAASPPLEQAENRGMPSEEAGGPAEDRPEQSVEEGGLDRRQRVALLVLVAIPLIPVGYGVGSLIAETLGELLK